MHYIEIGIVDVPPITYTALGLVIHPADNGTPKDGMGTSGYPPQVLFRQFPVSDLPNEFREIRSNLNISFGVILWFVSNSEDRDDTFLLKNWHDQLTDHQRMVLRDDLVVQ